MKIWFVALIHGLILFCFTVMGQELEYCTIITKDKQFPVTFINLPENHNATSVKLTTVIPHDVPFEFIEEHNHFLLNSHGEANINAMNTAPDKKSVTVTIQLSQNSNKKLFVVYGGMMSKILDLDSIGTADSGMDDTVWLSKFFEKEQNVLIFVNVYHPCLKFSPNNNKCVCVLPVVSDSNNGQYDIHRLQQKWFDANSAAFVQSLLEDYSGNEKNKVWIYIYGHPCGGYFFDVLQDNESNFIAFNPILSQQEIYKKGYYSGSFITDEISDSEYCSILYSIGHGDLDVNRNYSCFIHMQNNGSQQYSFIKDQYSIFSGAFNFENLIKGFSNRIDRNGYFLLHLFHCYSAANFSYALDGKKVTTNMSKNAAEIMRHENKLQGQVMGADRDYTLDKDGHVTNSSFSYVAP